MRLTNLLWSLLGALALSGCSGDETDMAPPAEGPTATVLATVLRSGAAVVAPQALTRDGEDLYLGLSFNGEVLRVPRGGGTATAVTQGLWSGAGLSVYGGALYAPSPGGGDAPTGQVLRLRPAPGARPAPFAQTRRELRAATPTAAGLAVVSDGGPEPQRQPGAVTLLAYGDGKAQVLRDLLVGSSALCADEAALYVAVSGALRQSDPPGTLVSDEKPAVLAVPLGGPEAPTPLWTAKFSGEGFGPLAAASGAVFAVRRQGDSASLETQPRTGAAPRVLAAGLPADGVWLGADARGALLLVPSKGLWQVPLDGGKAAVLLRFAVGDVVAPSAAFDEGAAYVAVSRQRCARTRAATGEVPALCLEYESTVRVLRVAR